MNEDGNIDKLRFMDAGTERYRIRMYVKFRKTFDLIALTCACCRTSQSYPCITVLLSLILVGWEKMTMTTSKYQAYLIGWLMI